jgi:hypothetical protein
MQEQTYLRCTVWVHVVLTASCVDTGPTAITFKHTLSKMIALQALAAEDKLQQQVGLAAVKYHILYKP